MGLATLDIQLEQVGKVTVVTLSGPVDSATHDHFKQTLDPLFTAREVYVLLDCKGLTYINSRGLGLLASYHRLCFASRGWMAICNVDRKTVKTMDLLGLGKMLQFYPSREEALAAMK